MEKNKIRISDIAEKAGVSEGTVDRVIHNRAEVSKKTRTRVLKIIDELNYKPNIFARTLAKGKSFVISVILPLPEGHDFYWQEPLIGVKKAIMNLSAYNVELKEFLFHQFDKKHFNSKAEELLKIKPDAVLLAPILYNQSQIFINKLEDAGIPYSFIDSDLKPSKRINYTGQDSFQSGRVAADLINYSFNKGLILIINNAFDLKNFTNLRLRVSGFKSYFSEKEKGSNVINIEIHAKTDKDYFKTLKEIFNKYKDVKAVFAADSKIYRIAEYIEKESRSDIILVGFDCIKRNIEFLEKGLIRFLITQNPYRQGYNGVMSIFMHSVLKEEIEEINYLPIDIITKNNYLYYKDPNLL
ncbi:substrate-binding domain-containing protein [Bacteroidota bacterium]